MTLIERFRELYEYEIACNHKMLAMLQSVPQSNRSDERFQRAVTLAGHLAACRENFHTMMIGRREEPQAWFDPACTLEELPARYAALEANWTAYLAGIDDATLAGDFGIPISPTDDFPLQVQIQVEQLAHHASYHRGQIVVLVDQLGGETVDTDYVYWKVPESE